MSVRWDTWRQLRLSYTPLDTPVVFGGTVVRYVHDPRIMTRELAAFDARVDRVEELVLITLRELGYLGVQIALGREVLASAASSCVSRSDEGPLIKIHCRYSL